MRIMSNIKPLKQRPYDLFFVVIFSMFTVSSLFFDILNGLDVELSATGSNPLGRLTYEWYAKGTDPLLIENPSLAQYATLISALVWGPMYLMFVYGFWKQKSWIRVPGLLYSGALTYSMLYYIWIQLADPDQTGLVSEHPVRFLLFNGPYLVVPILLGFRLRKAPIF